MTDDKIRRLNQVARELNVGISTIVEHLHAKGFAVDNNPNAKITGDQFEVLSKTFKSSASDKREASSLSFGKKPDNLVIDADNAHDKRSRQHDDDDYFVPTAKTVQADKPLPKPVTAPPVVERVEPAKLAGIKVLGKIDLGNNSGHGARPNGGFVPTVERKPEPLEVKPVPAPPVAKADPPVPAVQTPVADTPVVAPVVTPPTPTAEVSAPVQMPAANAAPPEVLGAETTAPADGPKADELAQSNLIEAKAETLKGLTVLGKIQLPVDNTRSRSGVVNPADKDKKKRKRKRMKVGEVAKTAQPAPTDTKAKPRPAAGGGGVGRPQTPARREEVTDKQIQDQIKATLAKLSGNKPNVGARIRRDKRQAHAEQREARYLQEQEDSKTLRVTEFISANDLASLMNVTVNEVISACLGLGMFVSINQRLDGEAIKFIALEFGYDVEFISAEDETDLNLVVETDTVDTLVYRAPIVTIMGHVDHGKTSLLDYIRRTKVAAGEAGGITQHIGAYGVTTDSGKNIAFLDTPGHEAFTAMRARGAKITDVAIIVVAADDNVMPQTKEAINHARSAGVPIVIALNKIDKPGADPDRIRQELSQENILVEEWGGKYQCEEISAKTGQGISELLEKVLLEAELLDLKANPNKGATGTVIEAMLDKGRGYVTTVMVQAGTLKVGDILLAGAHYGRVKAMTDYRGQRLQKAGPSTPVQVLGLPGAPQAGDKFNVVENEREAREISTKREQILREQNIRTRKHITLDEIGRRKAIGTFKELNIIIKGDVDGSIEALSDALLGLRKTTEEVQVNVIHKAVGAIAESDVNLAIASDAVIVGFQVRPSVNARKLAEQEQIEIRLYSIIYDAVDEIKAAMEGMLAPKMEEVVIGTAEVRQVFKITKVGTVAGCGVIEGLIRRNAKVRVLRDHIVLHTGDIDALKRMKEDVSDVKYGYECGISIKGFNDILEGDHIEAFEMRETKRTL